MDTNKRPTVFFVDDEQRILNSIIRLTNGAPYDVFTFVDPNKAMEELEKREVAVVVSDQMMPAITGTTFLEMVKEEYPDTVRIIFSGFIDVENILSAINYGKVFQFIAKPWNDDEFLLAINDAIAQYNFIKEYKRLNELTIKQNQELVELNQNLEQIVVQRTRELIFKERQAIAGRMVHGIVHNFRSPLMAAMGFTCLSEEAIELLLQCSTTWPPEQQQAVEQICKDNKGAIRVRPFGSGLHYCIIIKRVSLAQP